MGDKIKFQKNREMTDLERQHSRIIQDLQAQRTRVEINRTELKTKTEGEARVQTTQARQQAQVLEKQAASEKKVAKNKGLALKATKVSKAKAHDKEKRMKVTAECKAIILKAEKSLEAAANVVKALEVEADVEEKAAAMLKKKREHDLRMAKFEALSSLARNNKIIVSGESGDMLINSMVHKDIMRDITVA